MASNRITVDLPSGDHMSAYLARPDGPSSDMGIVLLQEIFGVNANLRAIADRHAANGIATIVPDLYWRQQRDVDLDPAKQADTDRGMALMKGMDQDQAAQDALAAADHVRNLDGGPTRIGAIGYCIGGKLAYLVSMQSGVEAAVSYYGIAIYAALDKAAEARMPLLLHLAEDDKLCPPDAQAKIKAAFAPMPNVEIMTYSGVGHAFARRGGDAYDAAAAERADKATGDFLRTHLGASK